MQKWIGVGNLTRDTENNASANGTSICKFSIAINRSFKNASGELETDFFNIVCFKGLADNCAKYLSKGKKVSVVGTVQFQNYTDKDGNKRQSTSIIAEEVEFLSPNTGTNETENKTQPQKKTIKELEEVEDDTLPF